MRVIKTVGGVSIISFTMESATKKSITHEVLIETVHGITHHCERGEWGKIWVRCSSSMNSKTGYDIPLIDICLDKTLFFESELSDFADALERQKTKCQELTAVLGSVEENQFVQ